MKHMRHQSNPRKAFFLKFLSIIFVIKEALILITIGYGLFFLINRDFQMLKLTLVSCFMFWGLLSIIFIAAQEKCVCGLCRVSPISKKRHCQKHKNAKRWLLSHRWPVIFGVLIRGFYTCPYCGELFKNRARLAKYADEKSKINKYKAFAKNKKRKMKKSKVRNSSNF